MSSDWYPGIKRFCDYWEHAQALQQAFDVFEQAFAEENDSCIDASQSLIECAFRIIIEDINNSVDSIKKQDKSSTKHDTRGFKKLLSDAKDALKLTEREDVDFAELIDRHFELAEKISSFRNTYGPVCHGRARSLRRLSMHHRRAIVLAADAVITFLHEIYLEKEPDPMWPYERYEHFGGSNNKIDEQVRLDVEPRNEDENFLRIKVVFPNGDTFPLTVLPSELLFEIDKQAYKQAQSVCREISPSSEIEEE